MRPVPTEFLARRLSTSPLIFIAPTTESMPIGPIGVLGPLLADRQVYALIDLAWTLENPRFLRKSVTAYREHVANSPKHRLIFLCNSPAEVDLLQAEHVPGILCNSNLFIDEGIFCIQPNLRRDFDAIYVAVLSSYKRHMLCRDVPRLALVYYDPQTRSDPSYVAVLKRNLPNAVFINEEYARLRLARPLHRRAELLINEVLARRGHVNLPPHEVAVCINRARVGLCLSEEEGQMAASMEYLLCGVPVVTTPSRGGRDHFFDSRFCVTVEPDAREVARAVIELCGRAPAPEIIRAAVLERLQRERRKLHDILRDIFEKEAITPRFADAWRNMPFGYIAPRWTIERFLSEE